MAIGAEDYIDQLLVKKYAEEKVDNQHGIDGRPGKNDGCYERLCKYVPQYDEP